MNLSILVSSYYHMRIKNICLKDTIEGHVLILEFYGEQNTSAKWLIEINIYFVCRLSSFLNENWRLIVS